MSASEDQSTEKLAEGFTRTWRYKVGLFMIIAGNGIILIGLLLSLLGVGASIVGAALLGGEVVSLQAPHSWAKRASMPLSPRPLPLSKPDMPPALAPYAITLVLLYCALTC